MLKKDTEEFLKVLFDEDEEICVSPDKYGLKSLSIDEIRKRDTISVLDHEDNLKTFDVSDIKLVSINPVKGTRQDVNVTAFRNFLIELDENESIDQIDYVKSMGLPYSVAVFSGNKSVHFGLCLDESLPSVEIYRFYANWILNIVSQADQSTKNPTRSIRFAGNYRDGHEQRLLSVKPRISLDKLKNWLNEYEGFQPKIQTERPPVPDNFDYNLIPNWVKRSLENGIDFSRGRNNCWFKISMALAQSGYDEDSTIAILEPHFTEEYDFRRTEWENTIKSAVKKIRQNM